MSLANTCDVEMSRPSAVDMIADRMPTPSSAASQVGKISMNSSGSALLSPPGASNRLSPSTARAMKPPKVIIGRSMPNVNAKARNRLRDFPPFSAQSLLPMCGSRPSGMCATVTVTADQIEAV